MLPPSPPPSPPLPSHPSLDVPRWSSVSIAAQAGIEEEGADGAGDAKSAETPAS